MDLSQRTCNYGELPMRVLPLVFIVPLALISSTFAQTEELIQRLKDPEARVRRLAAEALGKQKVEAAIPNLVDLLKDKERSVRDAASEALVKMGPKAVPAVESALKNPDEKSRFNAVAVLHEMGKDGKDAVPALTTALKDKNIDVRIRAMDTLRELGVEAKSALPDLFEAAKDTGTLGKPAPWSRFLASVPEAAIGAALKIDPECSDALAKTVLPNLTVALRSKDQAVVEAAAHALILFGARAKPATSALHEAYQNAEGTAEHTISKALAAIGGEATKPLAELIKNPRASKERRIQALLTLSLAPAPDEAIVAIMADALKAPEAEIRAMAVHGVMAMTPKPKSVIPTLLELLGDEELEKGAKSLPLAVFGMTDIVAMALGYMGPEAIPGLGRILQNDDHNVQARTRAAKALARMGRKAKEAQSILEAGIKDKNPTVASESACAYVQVGGDLSKSVSVLREGLKQESPAILCNTCSAIERIGFRAKELVPQLTPLLKHSNREVRISALRALKELGPAAKSSVPHIVELLKSNDDDMRGEAASTLERLGPLAREALPALLEQLSNPKTPGLSSVVAALGKIGPDAKAAVPALTNLLKTGDTYLAASALETLGQIGPEAKDAVPTIITHLDNMSEYRRGDAARALGRIGPNAKEAIPMLRNLLEDERKTVRVWATYALARINSDSQTQVPLLVEMWKEDRHTGPPGGMVRYKVGHALELLGPEARPARDLLLEAVLSEKTPANAHVARALGHLEDDADVIVPKLINLMERKTNRFYNCKLAAEALGMLGPKAKAAVPHLRKLLDDEENAIVDAAEKALERIGKP